MAARHTDPVQVVRSAGQRGRTIAGEPGDLAVIDGRKKAVVARFRFLQVLGQELIHDLPVFPGKQGFGGRQAQDGRRLRPCRLANRSHVDEASAKRRMWSSIEAYEWPAVRADR